GAAPPAPPIPPGTSPQIEVPPVSGRYTPRGICTSCSASPVRVMPTSQPQPHGSEIATTSTDSVRRLQTALNHSEAFYLSLVENLPGNFLRKDLDGRF